MQEFQSNIVRPKLKLGQPNDRFEQEADTVADQVMKMPASQIPPVQRKCQECEEKELQMKPLHTTLSPVVQKQAEEEEEEVLQMKSSNHGPAPASGLEASLQQSKGGGQQLPSSTHSFMSNAMGTDFSKVKIHTDANAVQMNRQLNARAFTHGQDIYFNQGQYNPQSSEGKHLLAHELTHVVQQGGQNSESTKANIIQRTSAGQVLDRFFSPFSAETLWVMDERDNYTRIVRRWQPVIDALNTIKQDLKDNCTHWSTNHRTDGSWTPGMTDPPVTDPNAFPLWVSSPPGTDPVTCASAFAVYQSSRATQGPGLFPIPIPPIPTIETVALHTCSIGSFGLYVTVDTVDCNAGTANLNIWIYNAMDEDSFGMFASLFPVSGMERQYMWWHWAENYNWNVQTPNSAAP